MKKKDTLRQIKDNTAPATNLQDEVVIKFLQVLDRLSQEEISCEQMFTQLDEFVEREVKSHDASKIMPLIQDHIDTCPECCDEYEALLDVLEHTRE